MRIRFERPVRPSTGLVENVFFGIWHPSEPIEITGSESVSPESLSLATLQGANWRMFSTVSPFHDGRAGALHRRSDGTRHVAFRGYIAEPAIHTYSSSYDILNYWQSTAQRHNGVFSAVIVNTVENSVSLLTDALGFGPLYYRRWHGALLFATNPRFLSSVDDEPDYLAWRCRLQTGFILSDRTLTKGISRVPAGTAVVGDQSGIHLSKWFDFDSLPQGRRRVTSTAFQEVEDQFQVAMTRCLRINNGNATLPLSSGHDSRRILASLLKRGTEFASLTVRVYQKDFRDLDAVFASRMAADFRFPHAVIEQATTTQYIEDDRNRRLLTDSETMSHTWALRLIDSLPNHPSVIWDGVLGDILGNPGFRMPGMYKSPAEDLALILDECISEAYDKVLCRDLWPTAQAVREDMAEYLKPFSLRYNMAEFAFMLLRQRRSTSLWSQQLMPAGHVVVCPYLDLDYISLLLEFDPNEKHMAIFQRECLRRFWPQFAKYSGNRDIPEDVPPGNARTAVRRDLACLHAICDDLRRHGRLKDAFRLLHWRKKVPLGLVRYGVGGGRLFPKTWGGYEVLELIARDLDGGSCWKRD